MQMKTMLMGVLALGCTCLFGGGTNELTANEITVRETVTEKTQKPTDKGGSLLARQRQRQQKALAAAANLQLGLANMNDKVGRQTYPSNVVMNSSRISMAKTNQDIGTFATNIWITLDSYIGYFERYATNNYLAARLANYRAQRLEYWKKTVSNELLLANASADELKRSAYFTDQNEQLVSTITNLVPSNAMEKKLQGRVFDLSDSKGLYFAISNIVTEMGGSVSGFPSFKE